MLSYFKQYTSLTFLLLILHIVSYPQSKLDSLEAQLGRNLAPAERASTLTELCTQNYLESPQVALEYGLKAESLLTSEVNDPRLEINLYYAISRSLERLLRNEEGLEYGQKALELAKELDDPLLQVLPLATIARNHDALGNYSQAINAQLEAINIAEPHGQSPELARAYLGLADTYIQISEFENAEKFALKAVEVSEAIKDSYLQMYSYFLLASNLKDTIRARTYIDKAIEYAHKDGRPIYLGRTYSLRGNYYFLRAYTTPEIQRALPGFKQSLKYAIQADDRSQIASTLNQIAQCYWRFGVEEPDSLKKYAEWALKYAEETGYEAHYYHALRSLSNYLNHVGRSAEAYDMLSNSYTLSDSARFGTLNDQVAQAAAKYQNEKDQAEIARQELQLEQERNRQNIFVAGSIVAILILISIYQWYLSRQRAKKRAAELALATEQTEASRLRELDQFKTRFFANISHELRTPLTLILSPLADISDNIKSLPVRDKLSIVRQNAQRLLELVNEIMDLSKAEVGKLQLSPGKLNIAEQTRRNFAAFESMAEIQQITYQLDIDLQDHYVLADGEKFDKILQNLLSNAIKFTPRGGLVELRATRHDQKYFFEVTDSGPGIAAEDLDRVFDRFFQAGEQAPQGGTGIGLALSREMALLMGGKLEAESTLGQGSLFRLILPLEKVETPDTPEPFSEPETQTYTEPIGFAPLIVNGDKPKLLIVEDNPDMGRYLVQILSDQYQCILTRDGMDGLKQLKSSRFDAVLSDVMMPNMDGFTFREKINERPEWKQIPFVMLTARHLEADRLRGFQLGIDDYLAKPFSTLELKARLHNLIQNKLERDAYLVQPENQVEREDLNQDQIMLQHLEQTVLSNLDNPQFGVADLAQVANYSAKQLGRIIKKQTGLTTVKFILEIRLQKARELLENRRVSSVFDAQVQVGIHSNAYFAKKFAERFGVSPSEIYKG